MRPTSKIGIAVRITAAALSFAVIGCNRSILEGPLGMDGSSHTEIVDASTRRSSDLFNSDGGENSCSPKSCYPISVDLSKLIPMKYAITDPITGKIYTQTVTIVPKNGNLVWTANFSDGNGGGLPVDTATHLLDIYFLNFGKVLLSRLSFVQSQGLHEEKLGLEINAFKGRIGQSESITFGCYKINLERIWIDNSSQTNVNFTITDSSGKQLYNLDTINGSDSSFAPSVADLMNGLSYSILVFDANPQSQTAEIAIVNNPADRVLLSYLDGAYFGNRIKNNFIAVSFNVNYNLNELMSFSLSAPAQLASNLFCP